MAEFSRMTTKDMDNLTIMSPKIFTKQATINIALIADKAQLKYLTGAEDFKYSYSNGKIYKHVDRMHPLRKTYTADGSGESKELIRHVSYVNCDDHEILATDSGGKLIDAALLLIDAGKTCPQALTLEQLETIAFIFPKKILIGLNIDKDSESYEKENIAEINKFISGTLAAGVNIIPIHSNSKDDLDLLCKSIVMDIPIPERDLKSQPRLIIRSFDDKPGCEGDDLKGTISKGVLKVGQNIELRPGVVSEEAESTWTYKPIFSTIMSLCAEENQLEYAVPGGLISVGIEVNPTRCWGDCLEGQVLGAADTLPDIYKEFNIHYSLRDKLLGVSGRRPGLVKQLSIHEKLMINIGLLSVPCAILSFTDNWAKVGLAKPVCADLGEKIALSRRIGGRWRLIADGHVNGGVTIAQSNQSPTHSAPSI